MNKKQKKIEVSGLAQKLRVTAIDAFPHIKQHLQYGGITIYTEKRGEVGSVNTPITEKDFLRRIHELWDFDAKDFVRIICHRPHSNRRLPLKEFLPDTD
jgi:hypothetical protein